MTKEQQTSTTPQEQDSAMSDPEASTGAADEGLEAEPAAGAEPTPGADAASAAEPSAESLSSLLEEARAKADENWNQLLRTRAELENLRRRHEVELEKAHKFALDGFVRELLQVRDSLELGHAAAHVEAADVDKLREGTELTLKLLSDVMGKFGVEPVDPAGEAFNPEYHQAMSMQPREDVPANTVVTVIQKGYLLNGRLVRPALVVVSQQPG